MLPTNSKVVLSFCAQAELSSIQINVLLNLWNAEYPSVLKHDLQTFQAYLNNLNNLQHTLITDHSENICAWYFEFDRNHERQFGIIVRKDFQQQGLGKKLIEKAKANNQELSAWVVDTERYAKKDGSLYHSPLPFYLATGFSTTSERWNTDKIESIKISWYK